jgi:HAD superfamily hydrolase (TIGR01549 family)
VNSTEVIPMPNPRAMLLDFYGTLVKEDEAGTHEISRRIAAASPLDCHAKEIDSYWISRFRQLCTESVGPAFRSQREIALSSLEQTLREFHAKGLSANGLCRDKFDYWARPEILPTTRTTLASIPVPVCLVSNIDKDDLQSALRHVGLRFDLVVTSEDCRSYKPRPEMFRKALSLLGLAPDQVLHVGDSIRSDIAGAKAAGIRVLWINPGGRSAPPDLSPDYAAVDLSGVLDIVW